MLSCILCMAQELRRHGKSYPARERQPWGGRGAMLSASELARAGSAPGAASLWS